MTNWIKKSREYGDMDIEEKKKLFFSNLKKTIFNINKATENLQTSNDIFITERIFPGISNKMQNILNTLNDSENKIKEILDVWDPNKY